MDSFATAFLYPVKVAVQVIDEPRLTQESLHVILSVVFDGEILTEACRVLAELLTSPPYEACMESSQPSSTPCSRNSGFVR